jgi:hypothetical protein
MIHWLRKFIPHLVGDCDRCNHSILYHPLGLQCVRCGCAEYK